MVAARSSGVSPGMTSTSASASSSSSGPKAVRATPTASPVPRCTDCSTNSSGTSGAASRSFLVTRSAPWPTTTTARRDLALVERVEDVEHHGPAAQQVERLGPGGPHAGALAGGEHDGGEGPRGHGPFLVRSGTPFGGGVIGNTPGFGPGFRGSSPCPRAPRPARCADLVSHVSGRPGIVHAAMGSLIKKRRKRMRKKKHKKMLKRTRFQRRAAGK